MEGSILGLLLGTKLEIELEKNGFEHPQGDVGELVISLSKDKANSTGSFDPFPFLSKSTTIINWIVLARFLQTDGVQSVMRVTCC